MARQKPGNGISWCDETWNVVAGCTRVSRGCDNCWACRQSLRIYPDISYFSDGKARWNGNVRLFPDRLDYPLRWTKPRRIAVGLMGDLFHDGVPDEFIEDVFSIMALAWRHTFIILTKRPKRMVEWMKKDWRSVMIEGRAQKRYNERTGADPSMWLAVNFPLPNLWIGVSVEDQKTADERIPYLFKIPAAVRFVSAEPLLGMIHLHFGVGNKGTVGQITKSGIYDPLDWVIVGGESGPGARPCHPDWVRSLRDQCVAAGVPFHFKQRGEWTWDREFDGPTTKPTDIICQHGYRTSIGVERPKQCPGDDCQLYAIARVGKKAAGHLLDGKEWLEFPK